MQEATARRYHRWLGFFLAVFLIVQAATGLLLSLGNLFEGHSHNAAAAQGETLEGTFGALHHGGGAAGDIYRLFLGAATLGQILLGGIIFLKIQARGRHR